MYAVIETGGKQYRVEVGTELEVELLDAEPGKTISFERVLLVADGDDAAIGQPLVDGAAVSAEVLRRDRGPKLIVFKYRPKARSRVKKGHRQELTILRINDIVLNGKSAAKLADKAEQDAKTERQRLEEAAVAQAAKDAQLAAKLAAPKASAKEPAKKSTAKASTAKAADEATEKKPRGKAETKPAAKADTKPAAKADAKAAPKKTIAKAKAADATDEPAPKKSAPKRATKRATKKDE